MIFFVTGNGSITNFPFVPTIKVITTSDRYKLLSHEMDVNASDLSDLLLISVTIILIFLPNIKIIKYMNEEENVEEILSYEENPLHGYENILDEMELANIVIE